MIPKQKHVAETCTLILLVLTFNTPYVVNDYFNHFVFVWGRRDLETR